MNRIRRTFLALSLLGAACSDTSVQLPAPEANARAATASTVPVSTSKQTLAAGNGVYLGNGVGLPNGAGLPNGISLSNGINFANGVSLGNGVGFVNGVGLPNGLLLSNGLTLPNGIVLNNGLTLANGASFMNGINIPNGLALPNGVTFNNGIVLPNGAVIPNGAFLPNGALYPNGTILPNGTSLGAGTLPNGIILGNGAQLKNGVYFANGLLLPNGASFANGAGLPNGLALPNGAYLNGLVLPNGASLNNGATVPNGTVLNKPVQFPNGAVLSAGATLTNGASLPGGAYLPNGGTGYSAGTVMAPGSSFPANTVLNAGAILGRGTLVTNGIQFPNGAGLPNGVYFPNGMSFPNGTYVPNGTFFPNGTNFGNGSILPNGAAVPNSACANGTCNNGVNIPNGVIAPTAGSDFSNYLADPAKFKIIQYLLQCAMTTSQSVAITVNGTTTTVAGGVGLAPNYRATGMLDTIDQEWVSACLLARVNQQGNTVMVDMVSPNHPALMGNTPGYTVWEAVTSGNLFTTPPIIEYYVNNAAHATPPRFCNTSENCQPFTRMDCSYTEEPYGTETRNTANTIYDPTTDCGANKKRFIMTYLPTGTCLPHSCATTGQVCGTRPDGCGGTLNCGTCACGSGYTCGSTRVFVAVGNTFERNIRLKRSGVADVVYGADVFQTLTQGQTYTFTAVVRDSVTGTDYPANPGWSGICAGAVGSTCTFTATPGKTDLGQVLAYTATSSCPAESDAQICARVAKNCGAVSTFNRCGKSVSIASCGTCGTNQACSSNVCVAQTVSVFSPTADTFVSEASPSSTAGATSTTLQFSSTTTGQRKVAFLTFSLTGLKPTVTSAVLRLYKSGTVTTPRLGKTAAAASNSTNWITRPDSTTQSAPSTSTSTYDEYTLTSVINGNYNITLNLPTGSGAYYSQEASNTSLRPTLTIKSY